MAFNYDKIQETEVGVLDRPVAPIEDPNYGIGSLLADGIQATFPFVQRVKHPMPSGSSAVDPEFNKEAWYKDVYPTLDDNTRAAIDNMGGARNQAFVDTIAVRQEDEAAIQQRMYDYGGLTASIGAQMVGSLVNPVDWAITLSTFGAGKYITTANMIRKVTNNYRKTSGVVLGALEGTASGYLSESVRQATGGIYDEDAKYDTTLFGTVLGGTLGASGWVKFLGDQNVNTTHKILNAMDVDTSHTKQFFEAPSQGSTRSVGAGAMRWQQDKYDIEDFADIPIVPKALQPIAFLSPKSRAYNVQIPIYRKILSSLVGSDVALKNKDGSFHLQSGMTAEDIKTIDFDGLKGKMADEIAGSFNDFNTFRVESGAKKMSEAEYGEYLYSQRIEGNKVYRDIQAEIDFLKARPGLDDAKLTELESYEIEAVYPDAHIKKAMDSIDTYYGEMDARRTEFDRNKRIKELEDSVIELSSIQQKELSDLQSYKVTPSKSYTTRIINKQAFTYDSNTKNTILAALEGSPTGKATIKYGTPEEIRIFTDDMRDIAENMVNKINKISDTQTLDDIMKAVSKDKKGKVTSGGKPGIEKGQYSIGRRIDIDENLMGDLLQRDMTGVLDSYHRDTGGRIAIKGVFKDDGINTWDDFSDKYGGELSKEYQIAGMSSRQITNANQDLQKVFNTIRGTADITKNPDSWFNQFVTGLTAIQNMRFGLGFGIQSLSEIGPAMAMGGVNTLHYMKPGFEDAMNKVNNRPIANEFIRELQGMGIGIDLQNSRVMERYTEGRADFESNKIINKMRQGENAAFRYGGLTVATDILKSAVGGAYVGRLYNLGNKIKNNGYKLSGHETAMFSRHGLTIDDLVAISEAPMKFDKNKYITAFNMEEWDPALAESTKMAITRAVKGNILEPTAMDLPWNTADPMHKLLFQYLRFPIAATPKLLQKAIAEKDVGAAMGAMVSTLVLAGNTYLMAQIANKIGTMTGLTDGESYDDIFNDKEQQEKLATMLWRKHPYLGVVPTLIDAGLGVMNKAPIGSDYRQGIEGATGPGLSYLYQMGGAVGDFIEDPTTLTQNQKYMIKSNAFILSAPVLKELSSDYLKDN